MKSESRIGPKAYLSPGAAFAGGTLARDIAFLDHVGEQKRLVTLLLSSVKPSNDEHKRWVRRKLQSLFPGLPRIKIAIWGLTYKSGTDTLRRSLAVELCNWLIEQGMDVSVFDPAVKQLTQEWETKVMRVDDPVAALKDARVLVVSTEWPQYRDIAPDIVAHPAPGIVILDANRFLPGFAKNTRVRYVAVGAPE